MSSLCCILWSIEGQLRVVHHIIILIIGGQVAQIRCNLSIVRLLIKVLFVFVDDLAYAEFNVRDLVLERLGEDRHHQLVHLLTSQARNHNRQRVQTAHAVVVALVLGAVDLLHGGNVIFDDPILLELLGEEGAFRDAHLANGSCRVLKIAEKYGLKLLGEDLLAEEQSHVGHELEDGHLHAPLPIRRHVLQKLHKLLSR